MPDGSNLPPMLIAALDYARRGIPVFPCNPENKKPLTPNGFKNATTYETTIAGWWRQWPDAMIGAPTGQISGCVVLDIDQDDEKGVCRRSARGKAAPGLIGCDAAGQPLYGSHW